MTLYMPRRSAPTPSMIFLANFRELIRGHPIRGHPCRIAYDPSRIIPVEGYDPQQEATTPQDKYARYVSTASTAPVNAHLQFRPDGPMMIAPLSTHSGPLREGLITADGTGTMLHGEFAIPPDAEWIMTWFTFIDVYGETHFDSRFGANYLFRFIEEDLTLRDAAVVKGSTVGSIFRCTVSCSSGVDEVVIRYRAVNYDPDANPQSVEMVRDGTDERDATRMVWVYGNINVPSAAVIAFDLMFRVGDRWFKEDNQGMFFVVAENQDSVSEVA
jgi:hypothetical protein